MYVPRDETFEEGKEEMLDDGELKKKLHLFIPTLVASSEECHEFQDFYDVDSLYKFHVQAKDGLHNFVLGKFVPFRSKLQEIMALLRFDDPSIVTRDNFSWFRDDEFARQTIAGINPSSIERLRVFPPVSKFSREVYGPLESALKEEHIIGHLNGMSVQQALEEKKLFILDYHDIYLPFLDRINSQPGRKGYATRTLFYLNQLGTLTLIAIELTLPPKTPPTRAKRVLTPPVDGTTNWAWQLAKAHVRANDAGVHQLVNHWLRTHAAMEPFILAANRQLSRMHPVYKLLRPHMRYTLDINGFARQILFSAGGVIESFFTSGSVSLEISAKAYLDSYRFDLEGLPHDLIRRGVAEPDATDPHGLRLLIPDYPYAADGLLLHSAISKFIKTYISTTYPNAGLITSDVELQNWYAESVNAGHADLRDAAWWPRLDSPESLVSVLTTVVWLCSAQHAALNFAQYPVGGYIPNRPPLVRRLVPDERDPEYQWFLKDPEKFFLSAMPTLLQAANFLTVIDTLSTHSKDEEYLGQTSKETFSWAPEISKAFEEFTTDIKSAEEEIERRNKDTSLRNRCGAGVLPYELLLPSSGPGITARGVPNSITI